MLRSLLAPVFALGMAGCAIHPLPEDFSGYSTHRIVMRIRCEARDSVRHAFALYLRQRQKSDNDKYLSQEFDAGRLSLPELMRRVDGESRRWLAQYSPSAIALDFTLDMTEENVLSGEGNFLKVLTDGRTGLGIGAGAERRRQNIRSFAVADTFDGLLTKIPPRYCDDAATAENHVYPIVGRIGIEEMIRTFINMHRYDNLTRDLDDKSEFAPPTMSDAIEFYTKLYGSVTPKIELSPIRSRFGIADASLTASAHRIDKHKVIVGLSLPTKRKGGGEDADPDALVSVRGNATVQSAARAIQQHIVRYEVGRSTPVVIERRGFSLF